MHSGRRGVYVERVTSCTGAFSENIQKSVTRLSNRSSQTPNRCSAHSRATRARRAGSSNSVWKASSCSASQSMKVPSALVRRQIRIQARVCYGRDWVDQSICWDTVSEEGREVVCLYPESKNNQGCELMVYSVQPLNLKNLRLKDFKWLNPDNITKSARSKQSVFSIWNTQLPFIPSNRLKELKWLRYLQSISTSFPVYSTYL